MAKNLWSMNRIIGFFFLIFIGILFIFNDLETNLPEILNIMFGLGLIVLALNFFDEEF